jgi:hypothetical protein
MIKRMSPLLNANFFKDPFHHLRDRDRNPPPSSQTRITDDAQQRLVDDGEVRVTDGVASNVP